jgi:hypothetical protein
MQGVKLLMSTVFHPQTDGAAKHANRTIAQILRALVGNNQLDWVRKIPATKMANNSSIN